MGQEMYTGTSFLWMIIIGAIVVLPVWRICRRVGYPGPLALLMLIPIANIILLYFIAFSRWKK